ncbi:MAG: c-type cytochrome [Pseudomonadota bacterium]
MAATLMLAACDGAPPESRVAGGDPEVGRAIVAEIGCAACHRVPGVAGPAGMVGPPLDGFGRRAMIAGIAANRPETLVRWLLDPPAMAPDTAMPDLGLSEGQARHVAAFLYTLR